MQTANDLPFSKNSITPFGVRLALVQSFQCPLPEWHHAYFFNLTQVPQLF